VPEADRDRQDLHFRVARTEARRRKIRARGWFILPDPQKDPSTTSPGLLDALMIHSK
jgi:hypothetical protein